MKNKKIKIACIKTEGMGAGGTERWLQFVATALHKEKFEIDYFYSDDKINNDRLKYMQKSGVNLISFHITSKKDNYTNDWEKTNFWEKFDESRYDYIQTAIFCRKEYPYFLFKKPVIEFISFAVDVDESENVLYTFTPTEWLRKKWIKIGGNKYNSGVIPVPVLSPVSSDNFRNELKIPQDAIVAGFHQRIADFSYSEIPLKAFKELDKGIFYFVLMGGSQKYREQARKLGLRNIRFIDHNANYEIISKFLNTLDIFVHGRSDGETYGSIFAEALIHGLPCLSHWTGIDDAQVETMGVHGLFAKNQIEYNKFLEKLFLNKDLRDKLTEGATEFAQNNYLFDSNAEKIVDFYENLEKNKWQYIKNKKNHKLRTFILKFYFGTIKVLLNILIKLIPIKRWRRKLRGKYRI